jgi:hypothetical protein
MYPFETTTTSEARGALWWDTLGAGFPEHTRRIEAHLDDLRRDMESLRPGSPSDKFQRYAGQIEALRWVLAMPGVEQRKYQKHQPGDVDE